MKNNSYSRHPLVFNARRANNYTPEKTNICTANQRYKRKSKVKKTTFLITAVALLQLCLSACAGKNMNYSGQYIKRIDTFKNDSRDGAHIIRYRPDGKHIAVTGGLNPHIYIYDVETGKRIKKLDKQTKRAEQLSYGGDGRYLVNVRYSEEDKKLYNVVRDVEQDYKIIHDDIVISSAGRFYYPAPNGKIIVPTSAVRNVATGKGESKLNIYTPPEMHVKEFWHNEEGFDNFSISPDGKYMVDFLVEYLAGPHLAHRENNLYHMRVWKYPEMVLVKKINNVHKYWPAVLAWSWDSKVLYTNACIDRKKPETDIKLWNTKSWEPIKHYQTEKSKIFNAFFLSDNRHLFGYWTHSRLFQLVNCYTDKVIEEIEFPDASYPYAMAQNPVKKNQFAFAFNTEIWIYEVELPTQLEKN